MENIEVKSRLGDRELAERRLLELGARRKWVRRQRDTFFRVERAFLKLREEEGVAPMLIAYERSASASGLRPSRYDLAQVGDAAHWTRLLDRVAPIDGVVEKERTLWLWGHTRIHLDRVSGLGDFLETETVMKDISRAAAEQESQQVFLALNLSASDLIAVPYRDLLQQRSAANEGTGC